NMILTNGEGIMVGQDVTGVVITGNNVSGNMTAGLDDTDATAPSTINAENNFWGSPDGPHLTSNPGGSGDKILEAVFGSVDYQPFLNHVALPFEDLFAQAGAELSRAWQEQVGFFTVQG